MSPRVMIVASRHARRLAALVAAGALVACAGPGSASDSVILGASGTPMPTLAATSPAANDILGEFDVGGGRSLTLECRGSGSPTLVFLVGTDWTRTQMRPLEDAFLAGHRVCDYDRDDPPEPRADTTVRELAALLEVAAVPGPYLLVGQSVGGNTAWLFASEHPNDTAGFIAMNPGPFVLDREVMAKVWTPEEMAAEFPAPGSAAEADGLLLQKANPPSDAPYIVMLSSVAQCDSPTDVCGRFYPAYEAWGRELASRTPHGRFIEVDAPHEIFETDRDAVVEAIQSLLEEVGG